MEESIALRFVEWMDEPMYRFSNTPQFVTRCILQQPHCKTYIVVDADANQLEFDEKTEFTLEELFQIFKTLDTNANA